MAPYRAVALHTFAMEQVQSCTVNDSATYNIIVNILTFLPWSKLCLLNLVQLWSWHLQVDPGMHWLHSNPLCPELPPAPPLPPPHPVLAALHEGTLCTLLSWIIAHGLVICCKKAKKIKKNKIKIKIKKKKHKKSGVCSYRNPHQTIGLSKMGGHLHGDRHLPCSTYYSPMTYYKNMSPPPSSALSSCMGSKVEVV